MSFTGVIMLLILISASVSSVAEVAILGLVKWPPSRRRLVLSAALVIVPIVFASCGSAILYYFSTESGLVITTIWAGLVRFSIQFSFIILVAAMLGLSLGFFSRFLGRGKP